MDDEPARRPLRPAPARLAERAEHHPMQTTLQPVKSPADSPGWPLVLRLQLVIELSDDQLLALCSLNRDLRIERNA